MKKEDRKKEKNVTNLLTWLLFFRFYSKSIKKPHELLRIQITLPSK